MRAKVEAGISTYLRCLLASGSAASGSAASSSVRRSMLASPPHWASSAAPNFWVPAQLRACSAERFPPTCSAFKK